MDAKQEISGLGEEYTDVRLDSKDGLVATDEHVVTEDVVLTDEPISLTCFDMWCDGVKAFKKAGDPLSNAVGCCVGTVCCIAMAAAIAEENDKPATRGDVVYARQHRNADAAAMNCAGLLGFTAGDIVIDSCCISLGMFGGGLRAAALSCTGNNDRNNTVFGYSRTEIDEVETFDSCLKPMCCQ